MPNVEPPRPDRAPLLARARGYAAIVIVASLLLVCDLVQRTLVTAAAKLFPRAKNRILARWLQIPRAIVLDFGSGTLGGAEFEPTPTIPARPGVLVIMNHQSLLDIPLIVKAVDGGFPRIVTRRRYSRRIPLISHIVRLYQYPSVDPQATVKGDLATLRKLAENGDMPLVIFPEGTRSRDGELGRWKRAGLKVLLGTRRWDVYVVVVDGLWRIPRFVDFVDNISGVRGRMSCVGPYPSPAPGEDVDGFIDAMRRRMEEALLDLRSESA